MLIRLAEPADAARVAEIYAPYVQNNSVSFEYEAPAAAEMEERIRQTQSKYPYLIAVAAGQAAGYAYAGPHRSRAAYQWNAELTVYLSGDHQGRGLGKILYTALMDLLTLQKVINIYGVVTAPNPASERLHEALGFRAAGRLRGSGYKAGAWHDIILFEKRLGRNTNGPPAQFRAFDQLDPAGVRNLLARYSRPEN